MLQTWPPISSCRSSSFCYFNLIQKLCLFVRKQDVLIDCNRALSVQITRCWRRPRIYLSLHSLCIPIPTNRPRGPYRVANNNATIRCEKVRGLVPLSDKWLSGSKIKSSVRAFDRQLPSLFEMHFAATLIQEKALNIYRLCGLVSEHIKAINNAIWTHFRNPWAVGLIARPGPFRGWYSLLFDDEEVWG